MQSGSILVGDAGGTNVRFALAHTDGGRVSVSDIWKRPGADYATFDDALTAFLSETKPAFTGAAFGVAGAVAHGDQFFGRLFHRAVGLRRGHARRQFAGGLADQHRRRWFCAVRLSDSRRARLDDPRARAGTQHRGIAVLRHQRAGGCP